MTEFPSCVGYVLQKVDLAIEQHPASLTLVHQCDVQHAGS